MLVIDAVIRLIPGVLGDEAVRGGRVAQRGRAGWSTRSTPGRGSSGG